MREIIELFEDGTDAVMSVIESLPELQAPTRIILKNPCRGGPPVGVLRKALASKGKVRFSATQARLFVDIDPGEAEVPLIGLEVIVRSDAAGLERMLAYALPYVDEIVIGVDGRSDDATKLVAAVYCDEMFQFGAADIGLSVEAWDADKIHFANARNFVREKLKSPWSLVIDSDEFLVGTLDLRTFVKEHPQINAFGISVRVNDFGQVDYHRLARTKYRWWSETHNQISIEEPRLQLPDLLIVQDLSLRPEAEVDRRTEQRNDGVLEGFREEAAKGNLNALFHLAKHKLGTKDIEGVELAQDYRFRAEVHGPLAAQRQWLGVGAAFLLYEMGKYTDAELWALRVMLDGPRIEAFCILGDIAEDQGDLERALDWYNMACACPSAKNSRWLAMEEIRWGRRAGIEQALGRPVTVVRP